MKIKIYEVIKICNLKMFGKFFQGLPYVCLLKTADNNFGFPSH